MLIEIKLKVIIFKKQLQNIGYETNTEVRKPGNLRFGTPLLLLLQYEAGQRVDAPGGILWCGFQDHKSTC